MGRIETKLNEMTRTFQKYKLVFLKYLLFDCVQHDKTWKIKFYIIAFKITRLQTSTKTIKFDFYNTYVNTKVRYCRLKISVDPPNP